MSYDPLLPSFQRSLPTLSSLSASSSARNTPPTSRSPPHDQDPNFANSQGTQALSAVQNHATPETIPSRPPISDRWPQPPRHDRERAAPLAGPPDPSSRPVQIAPRTTQSSGRAFTIADRSTAYSPAHGWQYQQAQHGPAGEAIKAEEEEPANIGASSDSVHRSYAPQPNSGAYSYHSSAFQEPSPASLGPHYPPFPTHAPRVPQGSYTVPNQQTPSPQSQYQYPQQTSISRTTVVHHHQQQTYPPNYGQSAQRYGPGDYPGPPLPLPPMETSRPPVPSWAPPPFDQEPIHRPHWADPQAPMPRSSSNNWAPQQGMHPQGPPSPAPGLAPAIYSPDRRYPYERWDYGPQVSIFLRSREARAYRPSR